MTFLLSGFSLCLTITAPHLNVKLEGSDGLLQHAVPLLLRQLHAVHPAAVELFEQVGAGDSGEGKERQTLVALKPHGLLGDSTQDLPSRQVTEVPGVSVGNQKFRIFFTDLEKKIRDEECYFSITKETSRDAFTYELKNCV